MTPSDILPQKHRTCLVAVGSNLTSAWGDPRETVRKSLQLLGESVGVIRAASRLYRTPAFPAGSGPDFVNAAVKFETSLDAPAVLKAVHAIEAEAGRERKSRWAARPLDLDLIALDDLVLPDRATYERWSALDMEAQLQQTPPDLILPHPRLQDRAFVLVPLAEVAPEWRHPVLGLSVAQMRDRLGQATLREVVPLQ